MLGLAAAILSASFLGSMHCVGMCGPMALWASGLSRTDIKKSSFFSRIIAYHLGRLITYMLAGAIAGTLASIATVGGQLFGWQQTAAKATGLLMIILGITRLMDLWQRRELGPKKRSNGSPYLLLSERLHRFSNVITTRLASLRPRISVLPEAIRPLAIGIVSTLLPCGWLYLFVLVAASTSTPTNASIVMGAFWLGTLPALSVFVMGMLGSFGLAPFFRKGSPIFIATLLLISGAYTASGRALVKLTPDQFSAGSNKAKQEISTEPATLLKILNKSPLPCCEHTHNSLGTPSNTRPDF